MVMNIDRWTFFATNELLILLEEHSLLRTRPSGVCMFVSYDAVDHISCSAECSCIRAMSGLGGIDVVVEVNPCTGADDLS